jgi:hypothetical protein
MTFHNIAYIQCVVYGLLVLNATFNDISVIFWQSILLAKETKVIGENH